MFWHYIKTWNQSESWKSHNLKTKQKPYPTRVLLFFWYISGMEFNLLWLEVCPASRGILSSLRALISVIRICTYVCAVCQERLRLVRLVNESTAILMWKAGAVGQMSYYCCSAGHTHAHTQRERDTHSHTHTQTQTHTHTQRERERETDRHT